MRKSEGTPAADSSLHRQHGGHPAAMHAADLLHTTAARTESVACVGLDPRPDLLPPGLIRWATAKHGDSLEAVGAAFTRFNHNLIDAIAGHCAAVKPQVACYEAYGLPGLQALSETIAHARDRGIPVIVDAKRGDIGSTAVHYRQAWFGGAPLLSGEPAPHAAIGDWITINGYLGSDGVTPFLGNAPGDGGAFVLVRTSNPSSADLQEQTADGISVADRMADLVRTWGADRLGDCGLSDVGAVVGATWPAQARALRERMPHTWFLVPGYGAQGGSAADALAGRTAAGSGVLVNSSRGIIAAWKRFDGGDDDWAASARAALDEMNADLGSVA